jgi:hypothetical protein
VAVHALLGTGRASQFSSCWKSRGQAWAFEGFQRGFSRASRSTSARISSETGRPGRRRIRPPFPYKLAMPAQQRVRADEERRPARSAEQSAGRSQENAVTLVQARMGDLAAKHSQFVPEHHYLELVGCANSSCKKPAVSSGGSVVEHSGERNRRCRRGRCAIRARATTHNWSDARKHT